MVYFLELHRWFFFGGGSISCAGPLHWSPRWEVKMWKWALMGLLYLYAIMQHLYTVFQFIEKYFFSESGMKCSLICCKKRNGTFPFATAQFKMASKLTWKLFYFPFFFFAWLSNDTSQHVQCKLPTSVTLQHLSSLDESVSFHDEASRKLWTHTTVGSKTRHMLLCAGLK